MRRQIILSILVLAIAIVIGIVLLNVDDNISAKKDIPTNSPIVDYVVLSPTQRNITINSQGLIQPSIQTPLAVEVSGTVKKVSLNFESGAFIKKGDVLVNIDDSDYQYELKSSQATLASAKAQLEQELAKAEVQKKNWLNTGKPLSSAPALLLRKPSLAIAKANVQISIAAVEKAKKNLDRTSIRAPYDAMISHKNVNLGQYISMGTIIGNIVSIKTAKLRLPIKNSDFNLLGLNFSDSEDKLAQIKIKLHKQNSSEIWKSKITHIEGIINNKTRMLYLNTLIDDPYQKKQELVNKSALLIGSYVKASIESLTSNNVFRIPNTAVYGEGKVLLINNKNEIVTQIIKPIFYDEDYVFVSDYNIKNGDRLCITPISNPIDGTVVQLEKQTMQ